MISSTAMETAITIRGELRKSVESTVSDWYYRKDEKDYY